MTKQSPAWVWGTGDNDEVGPLIGSGVVVNDELVALLTRQSPVPPENTKVRLVITYNDEDHVHFGLFAGKKDPGDVDGVLLPSADAETAKPLSQPPPDDNTVAEKELFDWLRDARQDFDERAPVPTPPTDPFPPGFPDEPPEQLPGGQGWRCYIHRAWCR